MRGDSGVGIDFFRSIASLEIGPKPVKIEIAVEDVEEDWEEGFLEKWRVVTEPWARNDPTKSWALLQDSTDEQKRVVIAPAEIKGDSAHIKALPYPVMR